MKNKIKVFVLGAMSVVSLQAQEKKELVESKILIKADTVQVSYENKLRPALEYISDANVKDSKKHWKSFLTRNYKVSSKSKIGGDLMISEDVTINSLSDKRMNLYAALEENGTGSKIKFYGAFGYDIYIGPENYRTEFSHLKSIVEDFLYESMGIFYNEKTNKISKEIASLTNKNASALKDNQENLASIKVGKASIVSLNEVEEDNSKAYLKARKKIEKVNKKIIKYNASIDKNKALMSANEEEIKLLNKDLTYFNSRKEGLKR